MQSCRDKQDEIKKDFLSKQCTEIEKNNKMGETRDLFKKTGNTKGTFHARIGKTKDRNCKDLTAAENNKRCQKYTKNYTRNISMTWITMIVWSLT